MFYLPSSFLLASVVGVCGPIIVVDSMFNFFTGGRGRRKRTEVPRNLSWPTTFKNTWRLIPWTTSAQKILKNTDHIWIRLWCFLGVVPHLQLSEAFFSSSSSPRESILNVHISLTICLLVMGIITTTVAMYTIYKHTICTEITEILVANPECKMNLHTHKNISLLAISLQKVFITAPMD